MVTTEVEKIPPAQEIFEDVKFRSWVNEVGLVVPMKELDSLEPQLKSGEHFTPVERDIIFELTRKENRGQVIPWKVLINGAKSEDPKLYLRVYLNRILAKLENDSIIVNLVNLGRIFGLNDHSFKPAGTVRLINGLWHHFDEKIPNIYLGQILGMTPVYLALTVNRFNNSRLDTAKVRLERYAHSTKLTWV